MISCGGGKVEWLLKTLLNVKIIKNVDIVKNEKIVDIVKMKKYGYDLPDCFGCREQAWDECEECDWIMNCSFETLKLNFGDKIYIINDVEIRRSV